MKMVKYSNEHKALINSRFVIVKDENVCIDCKHTFHDTHYFRKFSHLRNCQQQSEDTQRVIQEVNSADPSKTNEYGLIMPVAPPVKRKRKGGSDGGPEALSEQSSHEITESLVAFFIAANIPFATVENKEFKEFLETIRPSYAAAGLTPADMENVFNGAASASSVPPPPVPAVQQQQQQQVPQQQVPQQQQQVPVVQHQLVAPPQQMVVPQQQQQQQQQQQHAQQQQQQQVPQQHQMVAPPQMNVMPPQMQQQVPMQPQMQQMSAPPASVPMVHAPQQQM
mmetsp:Transcript_19497/g.32582  ORF Transcript_19497/g.32582 Transcript_19497/m.32582 type:complete len:280 (+) Transcript_19497:85-924(+)